MGNKKIFGVIALMLCTACCFAKQISFQIIQHDDSVTEILEQSLVVEDNILNGFFDDGYIVTNSSAEVSTSEDQDETLMKKGIGEAFNGSSDYFVQIKLYFNENPETKEKVKKLEQVDWVLKATKTGVTINSNSMKQVKEIRKSDDLYSITSDLLSQIKKAIKA